jgi:mannose-6-phosphate isomerase-like protein (cupin superfamily)
MARPHPGHRTSFIVVGIGSIPVRGERRTMGRPVAEWEDEMATEEHTKQRGITIYRAADAIPFSDADIMSPPELASDAVAAGYGAAIERGLYAGADARLVARPSADNGGLSLLRLWFKPDYPLPRHTHNVDCMYYVLSGSAVMGSQTLRPGDAFFVPAGAPYRYSAGPEGAEVLEIRQGDAKFDMIILDQPEEQWKAMAKTAGQRSELWSQLNESPTAAANRAE